jgi:hypothetical protein
MLRCRSARPNAAWVTLPFAYSLRIRSRAPGMEFNWLLHGVKRIAKAEGKDREEGCVAEIMVIACNEGRKALLKAAILIHRFAPQRWRFCRIACATSEGNLQSRLAHIVEPCFYRKAEVAVCSRNNIPQAQRKAR